MSKDPRGEGHESAGGSHPSRGKEAPRAGWGAWIRGGERPGSPLTRSDAFQTPSESIQTALRNAGPAETYGNMAGRKLDSTRLFANRALRSTSSKLSVPPT